MSFLPGASANNPGHPHQLLNTSNSSIYSKQQSSPSGAATSNNHLNSSHHQQHNRHISITSLSSITSSTSTLASSLPLDSNQVATIRDENDKLNKRLHLLRDEYVKLQAKHSDLQSRYDRLASLSTSATFSGGAGGNDGDSGTMADFASLNSLNSSSGLGGKSRTNSVDKDSSVVFVSKVLDFIGSLFNNEAYSDLTVSLAGGSQRIYAHKFVLKFRSLCWGAAYGDLEAVERMDLPELTAEVGLPLFKWIYSGSIALNSRDEEYILETVRYATQFQLTPLVEQCEEALIGFVRVENCIYFYQISEELKLGRLCEYAAKLVTLYWDSLGESDFTKASTAFLHRLFKEKSRYPLHKAIRIRNEDLIFLLLVDFDSQLAFKVNEFDNLGALPLDLALQSGQYSIAQSLLEHKANVDATDSAGWPLLHRYILTGQLRAAKFLVDAGANVCALNPDGDSALHLAADRSLSLEEVSEPEEHHSSLNLPSTAGKWSTVALVELLLQKSSPSALHHRPPSSTALVNLQNSLGDSALHRAIRSRNVAVFECLLRQQPLAQLELANDAQETPLWLALELIAAGQKEEGEEEEEEEVEDGSGGSTADTESDRIVSTSRYYFAQRLLDCGAPGVSVDWCHPQTGDSLLNRVVRAGNEQAALFLVKHGANVNTVNLCGESVLHLATFMGFRNLVSVLLQRNANCNLRTLPPPPELLQTLAFLATTPTERGFNFNGDDLDGEEDGCRSTATAVDPFASEEESAEHQQTDSFAGQAPRSKAAAVVYNQTPLHLAILGRHREIIQEILSYHDRASRKGALDHSLLTPDLNVKDSRAQTPLSLAVQHQLTDIAEMLINGGADVDVRNEQGLTLLHLAIAARDAPMAHFLLAHGADLGAKTRSGESYLQFAVRHRLPSVVEELCTLGADVNVRSPKNGDPVLWEALQALKGVNPAETSEEEAEKEKEKEKDFEAANEIASVLVRHRADTDFWHTSAEGGGFRQTLLHRALDENNEAVAVFLIRAGCDAQCKRKPGPNGEGAEDCDGQTPLHMACAWSMAKVVETLLEHSVDPNVADGEGKTPLHIAILNQTAAIVELLIEYPPTDLYRTDNYGHSPFSLAVKLKSRSSAQALTRRDLHVSEQTDGRGRNYLHLALERADYDSVLFLLDNQVDIGARVQDAVKKAPVHLAAESGSEIILRTLVLAGCNVNDVTMQNQTALHLAAELDRHQMVEILLDLQIAVGLQDTAGNNALHLAAQRGHLETSRALLDRRLLDLKAANAKGQTVLHCLANSPEKGSAAAIFDHLVTLYNGGGGGESGTAAAYELNARDGEGNTALLLAYMNGNGKLCRSIVARGAALGVRNLHGVSLFNHQMPTRQLLTSLLDSLARMPDWGADGPECLECGAKFGMTNRRHHCRHCGRELCSRCSAKEVIIMKFQQEKKSAPSRVCELCYDVLTVGVFN